MRCVSIVKYSVRDCKDNSRFESSKLFQKYFAYFFLHVFPKVRGITQFFYFEDVITLLECDENHTKWEEKVVWPVISTVDYYDYQYDK